MINHIKNLTIFKIFCRDCQYHTDCKHRIQKHTFDNNYITLWKKTIKKCPLLIKDNEKELANWYELCKPTAIKYLSQQKFYAENLK